MKLYFISILFLFNINFVFAQTFSQAFDKADNTYNAGNGTLLYCLAKTGNSVPDNDDLMYSYLLRCRATPDMHFLDKFIIHSKRVQENDTLIKATISHDTPPKKKKKFKRWEIGVNGGFNFQKFKSSTLVGYYGHYQVLYPLTEHYNVVIQYYLTKKLGLNIRMGYDKYDYRFKFDPNYYSSTVQYEKSYFVYNIESDFVYSIKMNNRFWANTFIGFKTSSILKEFTNFKDYYYYTSGATDDIRKPSYKFNLHASVGLQLKVAVCQRINLNASVFYCDQLIDFKDYLPVPLGGYSDWKTILNINHISTSAGISYKF